MHLLILAVVVVVVLWGCPTVSGMLVCCRMPVPDEGCAEVLSMKTGHWMLMLVLAYPWGHA